MKMEKPDLNRMWETFIKIGLPTDPSTFNRVIHMIRLKMYPIISSLKKDEVINWHHFLIHGRGSGVPTTKDDDNAYFHIRFSLKRTLT